MYLMPAEPPSELMMWSVGTLDTERGSIKVTPEKLASIYANFEKRGRAIAWDIEHNSAIPSTGDPLTDGKAPAVCWLELRAGGNELWMAQIKWSPAAYESVKNREWHYYSPELNQDYSDIYRIALTNSPATWGIKPLIALSTKAVQMAKKKTEIAPDAPGAGPKQDPPVEAPPATAPLATPEVPAAPAVDRPEVDGDDPEQVEDSSLSAVSQQLDTVLRDETLSTDVRRLIQSALGVIADMQTNNKEEQSKMAETGKENLAVPAVAAPAAAPMVTEVDENTKKLSLLARRFPGKSADEIDGELMALSVSSEEAKNLLSLAQNKAVNAVKSEREALIAQCISEGKVSPRNEGHLLNLREAPIETLRAFQKKMPSLFVNVSADAPEISSEALGLKSQVPAPVRKTAGGLTIRAHKKL